MSILDANTKVINEGTPFEEVVTIHLNDELKQRVKELRTYYLNKKRKVTVRLVGAPYEREHWQGTILVQDYKLSNSERVYSEFVVLIPKDIEL